MDDQDFEAAGIIGAAIQFAKMSRHGPSPDAEHGCRLHVLGVQSLRF